MKNKIKSELVKQVWLNFSPKESWMKIRTAIKDQKCLNCSSEYSLLESNIAIATVKESSNKHICEKCGKMFIENGVEDIEKLRKEFKMNKEIVIKNIRDLGNYNEKYTHSKKLEDLSLEELKSLYDKQLKIKEKYDRINAITLTPEEMSIENYLIDDCGVIQHVKYLKCEEQIEQYFIGSGSEYFDCGQGYSQDEAIKIIKIGFNFYEVTITAEIGSAKQDAGDRLYWVEKIDSVLWKKIGKPIPKLKAKFKYEFLICADVKPFLDNLLKENKINFKLIDSVEVI